MVDDAEEKNEDRLALVGHVGLNLCMHVECWVPVIHQISKGKLDLGEKYGYVCFVLHQAD